MCENNPNYIYLLQTREFVRTNENIYKIGQTRQKNNKRLKQYPDGSILLFQMICNNCVGIEKIIIEKFKQKFEQVKKLNGANIGNEYFRGNYNDMIEVIYSTIKYSNILETYNVPELKQLAKSIKITCNGNRNELVNRIIYSLDSSNIEIFERVKPQEIVEPNCNTLEDMTIPELKEIAKSKDIKIFGNKKEIINKITNYLKLEETTISELKEIAKSKDIKIFGNKKEIINKITNYLTLEETLEEMTISELKEIAKSKDIKISGNKKMLIRLMIYNIIN
jgi:hypothetical protein